MTGQDTVVDGIEVRFSQYSKNDAYSIEYYMSKGLSYDESVRKIIFRKKKGSKFNKEFYIDKGYSEEDAIKMAEDEIRKREEKELEGKVSNKASSYYYMSRGYSEEESKKLALDYKSRHSSKRCIEYWIDRGYSREDAISKVSEVQRECSPRCIEYWIKKGFSEEEAIVKVSEKQSSTYLDYVERASNKELRENSPRCIEYYLKRGFTEEEAKEGVRNFNDTLSLDSFIRRYGEIEGRERFRAMQEKMSKSTSGSNNAMFGKSSPKGSGYGISGYYKTFYFRSLYEYFYMKQCESKKISFICNDVSKKSFKDKIVIPIDGGHNYIPDFIVGNTVVEIKNTYSYETDFKYTKLPYLEKYCEERSMKYQVLTQDDLNLDYNMLKMDFESGTVVIDKGKLERFKRIIS